MRSTPFWYEDFNNNDIRIFKNGERSIYKILSFLFSVFPIKMEQSPMNLAFSVDT